MGKYIRIFIVIIAVLGVAILAKNNVAWAEPQAAARQSDLAAQDQPSLSLAKPGPGSVKPPPGLIIPVTGGGTYAVGGVCTMAIAYNISGLSDQLSLEVPVEKSSSVPFPESNGKIHLPGCHILHYQSGELMTEMSEEAGTWTICFAAQPNKTTTIYYYLDTGETLIPIWIPLETTVQNGIACASANTSGVYAPASK